MLDPAAHDFLLRVAADVHPHRRGSLLEHLERTAVWLADWQCRPVLVKAGQCHAIYGTDGLIGPLVPIDQRSTVAVELGTETEQVVYTYAACDRAFVHPQLECLGDRLFRDRFTGLESELTDAEWADFLTLTWANGADVITTSADLDWSESIGFFRATASEVPPAAQRDLGRLLDADLSTPLRAEAG